MVVLVGCIVHLLVNGTQVYIFQQLPTSTANKIKTSGSGDNSGDNLMPSENPNLGRCDDSSDS